MTPSLFRDEALRQQLAEVGTPPGITTGWARVYALVLVAVLAGGVATVAYGSYARKSRVSGFLMPDKGLIKVVVSQEGRLAQLNVTENQHVAKDALLAVIDVDQQSLAGSTAELIVRNLRSRRGMIEDELTRLATVQAADVQQLDATITANASEMAAVGAELLAEREEHDLATATLRRYKTLQDKAVYSQAQIDKAEKDVATAEVEISSMEKILATSGGDLARAKAQRQALPDKQANDRSQLQRTLGELDQQVVQAEQQQVILVRATESGTATRLTAQPGASISPQTPLMTIVPDGATLVADLYVPSGAAGFVKTGDPVLLRYEAYPYEKFGVQSATVITVSQSAVDPKELPFPVPSEEPLYLVTASLAKGTVTAFGQEQVLEPGSKFEADIVLETRRIWEWAIEPLLAARQSL